MPHPAHRPLRTLLGVVTLAFALLAGCATAVPPQQARGSSYDCGELLTPAPADARDDRLGFAVADLGRQHAPSGSAISYDYCPPASGMHYSDRTAPLPPAVYGPDPEAVPGQWVHNLEHGYVALLYRCSSGRLGGSECITEDELDQLATFFEQAPAPPHSSCPGKVVVAPFDSMTTRFATVAWGRVLLFDELDLDQARTFAEQWMEQDREVVPELAAC